MTKHEAIKQIAEIIEEWYTGGDAIESIDYMDVERACFTSRNHDIFDEWIPLDPKHPAHEGFMADLGGFDYDDAWEMARERVAEYLEA